MCVLQQCPVDEEGVKVAEIYRPFTVVMVTKTIAPHYLPV